ncbi:VPA1262 family protein [Pseudomonas sp. VEM90]
MTLSLHKLFSDTRLHSIFNDPEHCTIQLWLLEYINKKDSQIFWIYGRVLPSNYASNRWNGRHDGKPCALPNKDSIRVVPITASTTAFALKVFTQRVAEGCSLLEASQLAGIALEDKLAGRLGQATLGTSLCIRPVMHLPTRCYYKSVTQRLSPSAYASYDSGSISALNKASLFTAFGMDIASDITRIVCDALNADTGMDFAKLDAWRLGDFEFLCAPALDRSERCKYQLKVTDECLSLEILEPFTPQPRSLMIIAKSFSGDCLQSSHMQLTEKDAPFPQTLKITTDRFGHHVCTAMTLEVHALSDTSTLTEPCLQVGHLNCRQMTLDVKLVQQVRTEGNSDWLENQVSPSAASRLVRAKEILRASPKMRSHTYSNELDPWVDANAACARQVLTLLPPKSAARYFPRLAYSQGEGRLGIVAWLREIFEKFPDCQIAWFDPHMEDVGIDLLHRLGSDAGDYLIFTTEKKASTNDNTSSQQQSDTQDRILNLLGKCREWGSSSFGNVHLRVIALPEKKLHDRMLIIRSKDRTPIAGYHLSNSIQQASEQHPFLVTSIPGDILPGITHYMDEVTQAAFKQGTGKKQKGKILFDSSECQSDEEFEPPPSPALFDMPRLGDVIAWWFDEPELQGLQGTSLQARCTELGITDGESPSHSRFGDIPGKLWIDGLNLQPFHSAWDAMAHLLGYLPASQTFRMGTQPLPSTLEQQLLRHLDPYRDDSLPPTRVTSTYLDIDDYHAQPLDQLLIEGGVPYRIFSYAPPEVDGSDWHALCILWLKSPERASQWLADLLQKWVAGDRQWSPGRMRHKALIISTLRHICQDPYHGCKAARVTALLATQMPLLQWIGLHDLSQNIQMGELPFSDFDVLQRFPAHEHTTLLCWLISEAHYQNSENLSALVNKLLTLLPDPLPDDELECVLKPLQYRYGRSGLSAWILEHVLVPMRQRRIISPVQIAKVWTAQLTSHWNEKSGERPITFAMEREGAFTDELAVVFDFLSDVEQREIALDLQRTVAGLARTIRLPISAQVNWHNYSRAHEANLWLNATLKRCMVFAKKTTEPMLTKTEAESAALIDRISPAHKESSMCKKLMAYTVADPTKLIAHRLMTAMQLKTSEA